MGKGDGVVSAPHFSWWLVGYLLLQFAARALVLIIIASLLIHWLS